ncbi:MAG: hypothetical protein GC152_13345 [Alphaproteobacteria bacterium]|nr:hypothetical protein [Alphaproteobacteria bacterium]
MKPSTTKMLANAALCGACSLFALPAHANEQGQIIAANYGTASLPPNLGQLVCPAAPGLDGIPVHFETEVIDPVYPKDFIVLGADGAPRPVLCATFDPSDDVGDRRSILLVGEFGDGEDQPLSVEVVGDIRSTDLSLSYKGAYADIIPLEAPPALILAEVVPEEEWDLDSPGTPVPWGGGTGCPSSGTRQVLRVGWGGGVRAADGAEVTAREWERFKVALRTEEGRIRVVSPFALGDLNDNDNNHELCLNVDGTPLAVRFPGGLLIDPNGDVNKGTRIPVSGASKF